MPVPLEVSIARLIGDPKHLQEQPEFYPEAPAVYVVCPECKREMMEMPYVDCYGTVVSIYRCEIHGRIPPIKSAVVNRSVELPDWSAA
jgi:hypothetical protein